MSCDQEPKRRWYQFSIKTLLAFVVLSCVAMGLLCVPVFRARRQAAAVAAMKKLRCSIVYDYQLRRATSVPRVPPGPTWLRRWIGDDYFTNVVEMSVNDPKTGDADLNHLQDLPRLEVLELDGTHAGNQGLKYLAALKRLRKLSLRRTAVTDEGLASIEFLIKLTSLDLSETLVTDSGLLSLKKLVNLSALNIAGTQVNDTGIGELDSLKELEWLDLGRTNVTGEGLAPLGHLKRLRGLDLSKTQVADRGLEHLKSFVALERLDLTNTRVTGTGLEHLEGLPKLSELRLSAASMTDAGLRKLEAGDNLKTLLLDCPNLTDGGLENLGRLAGVEQMTLSNTQVTDLGLELLTGLKQLRYLGLSGTPVSDAGIDALNAIPALVAVDLQGTRVTEAGLARLKARGAVGGPLPSVTRVLAALGGQSDMDFTKHPLGRVIGLLKAKHDIEVHLDSRLTATEGAATPITAKFDGIPLAVALDEILKPAGLDYDLRYEMLYISVRPIAPRLRLPEVAEGAAPAATLDAALAARTEADFTATPVSQVLAYLQAKHGIQFKIDEPAFEAVDRTGDAPVTMSLKGVSLHSLLEMLFDELNMTCVLDGETLVVKPMAAESPKGRAE